MRYKQLLSEQQLDELRMNPRSLQKFAASPEAEGIQAGFEAELVFTGLGGASDDYDSEPDYDADERCYSIQQVIDFFENDDYGNGMSSREASHLQNKLDETYYEWYDDQMYQQWKDDRDSLIKEYIVDNEWDWENAIREKLDDKEYSDGDVDEIMKFHSVKDVQAALDDAKDYNAALDNWKAYEEARDEAKDDLDSTVDKEIEDQGSIYDRVYEEYRDNFTIDDDSGFFQDVGLRWMSDIANEFELNWPIWTDNGDTANGEYDYGNAEMLAQSLSKALGVKAHASGGYHSTTRRPGLWILEPDGSLDPDEPDNMPVEFVSPPMPLEECLRQIENFFSWAEGEGAYANSSTGFHMGVSLPHTGGKVDFIKLALFLGDEHVLREFGRISNTYAEAAMKKIRAKVSSSHNKEQIAGAMELMRSNLIELATRELKIVGQEGFGKYTSINPHVNDKNGGYIEFRSAGGVNYFEDIDKLKNTLLRYAQAMHVASRPDLERNEYYKKLYKLISPTGDSSLDLFAKFATGSISKEDLKKQWAETALSKEVPGYGAKGHWKLYNNDGKPVPSGEFNGYTEEQAWEKAASHFGLSVSNAKGRFKLVNMNEPGVWQLIDPENEEVVDTIEAKNRGEAMDKFYHHWSNSERWSRMEIKRAFDLDGSEEPEPKLSRRAELAKRIKAPKPNWNVVYRPTGRVVDSIINVSREEAQKLLPKVAQQQGFSSIDDLELHNQKDYKPTDDVQDTPMDVAQNFEPNNQVRMPNGVPVWEIYNRNNDSVVHVLADHTRTSAIDQAVSWLRNTAGVQNLDGYQVRPKMLAPGERNTSPDPQVVNQQPAQQRSDVEFYQWDQPERVLHTMRNATRDEMMDWIEQQERGGMPPGFLRVRPLSQTNESVVDGEWESIVESMIKPVGRLVK